MPVIERKSTLAEILKQPTTINNVHESVYRVAWVLRYVERLLRKGAPAEVVLDFIEDMENAPRVAVTLSQNAPLGSELRFLLDEAEEEVRRKADDTP